MFKFSTRARNTFGSKNGKPGMGKWFKWGGALVALVIIGAMVLGNLSGLGENISRGISSPGKGTGGGSYPTSDGATTAPTGGAAYGAPALSQRDSLPAAAPAKGTSSGSSTSSNSSLVNIPPSQTSDRKIIRNASLSLQVDDVEKFLGQARSIADEQKGLVTQASTTLKNDKLFANITLQVPSPAFDATISRLRQLAYKIDSENSTSQDVSEEFVDLDAQVRTLQVSEGTYLELLKKATSVNDTITIQRELNNVRTNIERIQGRLDYLQKKSDFSTITLTVSPKNFQTVQTSSFEVWTV